MTEKEKRELFKEIKRLQSEKYDLLQRIDWIDNRHIVLFRKLKAISK